MENGKLTAAILDFSCLERTLPFVPENNSVQNGVCVPCVKRHKLYFVDIIYRYTVLTTKESYCCTY